VAILGGGLAGLTLSIQLKQMVPEVSVAVLEKREGPAPLAAFNVGESTVLAGAHYFDEVVGMGDHLRKEQLIKLGLRFFPSREGNLDITKRPEKGPSDYPEKATFQIDRGLFENRLASRARALGVDLIQAARVREVTFGGDAHTVTFHHFDSERSTQARWIVDAAGRASLLKRQLGFGTDSGHHINSAWFRLSGGLDLEEWGAHDPAWFNRMSRRGIRQYSTNHLIGEGYWIWLIPLATGPISIGVCADPRFHPFDEISELDKLLDWLREHEPQLAAAVEGRIDDIEDFLRVEDYSYGVEQTYSADRWALVGEAAAFADPFYSPGSDFIAIGNTFTSDLIARDLAGEDITERLEYFNDLYQRAFEAVMTRHRDSYVIYGNPGVAMEMLYWMTVLGHTGMTLLFIQGKLTDLEFMKSINDELERLFQLNARMHDLFRSWNPLASPEPPMFGPPGVKFLGGPIDPTSFSQAGGPPSGGPPSGGPPPGGPPSGGPPPGGPPPGVGAPPGGGPPPGQEPPIIFQMLRRTFEALTVKLTDDQIRAEMQGQLEGCERLAVEIFRRAVSALPEGPPEKARINPYGIGLDPARWDADGLVAVAVGSV
jgi:flavin-dependent dehydrogenase